MPSVIADQWLRIIRFSKDRAESTTKSYEGVPLTQSGFSSRSALPSPRSEHSVINYLERIDGLDDYDGDELVAALTRRAESSTST
ncbi:hypothetical protein DXZ75_05655 [Streptomyces sp. AcE210]|nr:hypothetical protein DXZ75_05655 [Streptomyces sp. AcE210]